MANLKFKIIIKLILLLTVSISVNQAQNKNDDQPIKVNTYLVNIPIIASDKDGRYISGLKKENFSIIQDGEKRRIEYFADEAAPMNIAILIDASASTRPFINDIKNAAWDFLKVFRTEDKALIAEFDSATNILSKLTSDRNELQKAIFHQELGMGGSNMQDAIYQIATKEFATVTGRKAIIVLTDGDVLGKLISNEKLLSAMATSDIVIYPIIFNFPQPLPSKVTKWRLPDGTIIDMKEYRKRMEIEHNNNMLFMNSLASASGGRLFDSNEFKTSFQSIADELKHQYLIGYYPQNIEDGKPHQVAVEVNPKDIVIRTKRKILLKASN